jgi:hypothetical protein
MSAWCHKAKQNHQICDGRHINLRSERSSWDDQRRPL